MPEDDDHLVVPGRKRDREVACTGAFRDRHSVHVHGPDAHGAELDARAWRRPLQPEPCRESQLRGRTKARLVPEADPPGARKGVGQSASDSDHQTREDEKRHGEREKAAGRRPPGDR